MIVNDMPWHFVKSFSEISLCLLMIYLFSNFFYKRFYKFHFGIWEFNVPWAPTIKNSYSSALADSGRTDSAEWTGTAQFNWQLIHDIQTF